LRSQHQSCPQQPLRKLISGGDSPSGNGLAALYRAKSCQSISRGTSPSRDAHFGLQLRPCLQAAYYMSLCIPQASFTVQYTTADQAQVVSPAAAAAAVAESSQHKPTYYEGELSRLRTWKAKQSRFCVEAMAQSSSTGSCEH
jgi:hypothetical protein